MPEESRKPSFAAIVIVIFIVAILGAVLIPMSVRTTDCGAKKRCGNNLRELHKCVILYRSKFGGPEKLPPEDTGAALWSRMLTEPTDVLGTDLGYQHPMLSCPGTENHHANGDYFGPFHPLRESLLDSWIGADKPGNHEDLDEGGGNAIRNNGEIIRLYRAKYDTLVEHLELNNLKD